MIKEIAPADLRGHGLRLRTWQPDDVGLLLRGVRDPEYQRWNTHHAPILDEAAAAALLRDRADGWQRGDGASYCVTDETTGAALGHVGLTAILPALRTARVGYWILPEARGRGIAGHALELVSRWAFDDIGLHRIELGHAVGHEASCRIALRHAYVYEGTLRGAMPEAWGSGTFQDMHLHARLATDCA